MGSKPIVNAPGEEGQLLLRSIAKHLPAVIDAKDAIKSMEKGGSKHWKQMEWIGFYPEFWFDENLAAKLETTHGPRIGNMSFDLQRQHVWDLKAHSVGSSNWAPLNDIEAVSDCIDAFGGVGFLVLSGPCTYDEDGSFKKWHETLKGGPSDYSKRIATRGASSRRRKTSFTPNHLIAFRFSSLDEINRAKKEGWLKGFQEGMQNADGKARRAKIMVDLDNIGKWALIDEVRR
jgi:hypothetical protein